MSARSILMIVHSYALGDPRVRREAEAIAERGDRVDLICLRAPGESAKETVAGVTYWRLPLRRRRGGFARYLFEYAALFAGALALSIPLHMLRRYRVVQAHNMPDLLVFAGIVPWLSGAGTMLDLHDPVPEVYQSKFGLEPSSFRFRALVAIEGASIAFADHALAATGAFRDRLVARGRAPERIDVLLNSPDLRFFTPRERRPADGQGVRALFHGTITHRSGVDLAIDAVERVRARGVDLRLIVLGDGDFVPAVRAEAAKGDRAQWVEIRDKVPIAEVGEAVSSCDFGVIPNRPGPFHDLALPSRLFETLEIGRAVVVARSPAISALFGEDDVLGFEAGDADDLARVLERACREPALRERCVARGRQVARRHAWEHEKEVYLRIVDDLLARVR